MDRFASVPKTLLRFVCEAFQTSTVSIASLRTLYARRQTLYRHQVWSRTYLGLQDLDAAMAATIESGIGKAVLLKAIDWCYAPQAGLVRTRLEWLKTPPKRARCRRRWRKPFAERTGRARLAIGRRGPKQTASLRRPRPDAARIEGQRQTVEITCFLCVTLLELADMALLQASRRSQDLVRRAAERVEKRRSRSSGAISSGPARASSRFGHSTGGRRRSSAHTCFGFGRQAAGGHGCPPHDGAR
jgi:hypothetical protein